MATTTAPTTTDHGRLLRLALSADAVITGVNGLAYLALAGPLHDLLGTDASTLRGLGAFLVAFALAVASVARAAPPNRAAVGVVIAANALWVLDSLLVVAAGWLDLETAGAVWAVMQAVTVAMFAALQALGLRRE